MSVFVVVGHTEIDAIGRKVAEQFPGTTSVAFPPATWFVEASGTAVEVSERLTLANGGLGGAQGVVIPVTNYSGWAVKSLWDWLAPRYGKATSG